MLGALVAILASLSFSLSNVTVRRSVTKAPVAYGAMATVILGVPMFFIACLVTGQILRVDELALSSYGLLAAAGIIHYVVGRYFNYGAIEAIGAARAAPINTLGLPYSILIAFIFLGEGVSFGMLVGIGLIMAGPAIMVERKKPAKAPGGSGAKSAPASTAATPSAGVATAVAVAPVAATPAKAEAPADNFQLRQAEGYLYAVIAAAAYGTSPVLIRSALEGHSELSLLGGGISYVAAGAFLMASLILPSRRHLTAALEPASLRIFAPPAFFVFMAQLLRFVALSLASVAVVGTLMRFGAIFTLGMSWYMNPDLEKITPVVVLGVLITLVGAVLLVVAS
jgi:drug/metabolite transporter (DMT)-like permease